MNKVIFFYYRIDYEIIIFKTSILYKIKYFYWTFVMFVIFLLILTRKPSDMFQYYLILLKRQDLLQIFGRSLGQLESKKLFIFFYTIISFVFLSSFWLLFFLLLKCSFRQYQFKIRSIVMIISLKLWKYTYFSICNYLSS